MHILRKKRVSTLTSGHDPAFAYEAPATEARHWQLHYRQPSVIASAMIIRNLGIVVPDLKNSCKRQGKSIQAMGAANSPVHSSMSGKAGVHPYPVPGIGTAFGIIICAHSCIVPLLLFIALYLPVGSNYS